MSETEPFGSLFHEFPAVDTEDWKAKVQSKLGEIPDGLLNWASLEGVTMPAYLHREALDDVRHVDSDRSSPPLAEATDAPANAWIRCQRISHPDPKTANVHARAAAENGAHDLELIVAPTKVDDHGVRIHSVEDLATVLDGLDLEETGVHFGPVLAGPVLYGMLREILADADIDPSSVRGSVAYDPVAGLTTGSSPSVDQAFALADSLTRDVDNLPQVRSVTVDASTYHEAGASATQELAYMLGALAERLTRSTNRGLDLKTLLDSLQVIVPSSTSYLVELAKLRALRLLVPQVVDAFADEGDTEESFAPSDLFVHAKTSQRTETIYDPHLNMLRAATEAMTAVLGGCDALTVRPYDASVRPPDAFGQRLARNTQLVLRHEAHLNEVADPAAGSYYIETLTDKLARQAWEQFRTLEAEGGIVEALRNGALQHDIAETRKTRFDAIDEREHVLVGTTHYPTLDEQRRDDLADPGAPFSNGEPPSLDAPSIDAIRHALRDGATLDDVCAALRDETGAIEPLPHIRMAEDIESIRLRTEEYADTHEGPPRVLLAPIGPPAVRSSRATFARNFLGVAGLAIEEPLKFDTVDEAADTAVEQNADAVVLCSSNSAYADLAPAFTAALTNRGHDALLLIAGPPDDIDTDGGADLFIYQESPLKDTLERLQTRLGIATIGDA